MLKRCGLADYEHVAPGIFAALDELFQVASGNLYGHWVCDDLPGVTSAVFRPCSVRQSEPHAAIIYVELDVNGIGVASRDRHHQGLIDAVNLLLGPALNGVKILVHVATRIAEAGGKGQTADSATIEMCPQQ